METWVRWSSACLVRGITPYLVQLSFLTLLILLLDMNGRFSTCEGSTIILSSSSDANSDPLPAEVDNSL